MKDSKIKLNVGDEAEYIASITLDEILHPKAFKAKMEDLAANGMDEEDAREFIEKNPIRMEIYYQKECGLFAIECDAAESSRIWSPYTGEEMEWDI